VGLGEKWSLLTQKTKNKKQKTKNKKKSLYFPSTDNLSSSRGGTSSVMLKLELFHSSEVLATK
jgi:hypothetical protein